MRPSLTRRLLTLYAATIVVAVAVAAGFTWTLMRRALVQGLDDALLTEARAVASRIEADEGRIEFEARPSDHDPSPSAEPLVQIFDEQGQPVFSSPALHHDTQTLFQRAVHGAADGRPVWFTTSLIPGRGPFRVSAIHVRVASDDEAAAVDLDDTVGIWVVVARSRSGVDRTLGQLGSVLAVAVGAALAAALLGGLVVARRGMRPVLALAEKLKGVHPQDPQLALDERTVPIELAPMVTTTQRLLERVRAELTRQRQLTADVAHDLRTPVAGVRTLLDVCAQRERTPGEYAAAIDQARAALRQLSRLLDDVLALARLDAGADQAASSDVSPEEVVHAAVATVQPLAAAREVTISVAPLPQVEWRSDRARLVKIVTNLLSNAVEHSPPGESVRIAVSAQVGALELVVEDRGPGVPPELRRRIFDRFVRGDAARAGGGGADGHHGLGLPIAAGLARLLGGELTLDERHQPGSRFVVRLPLQM